MIYNSVLKGRQGEEGRNEEYRKAESFSLCKKRIIKGTKCVGRRGANEEGEGNGKANKR